MQKKFAFIGKDGYIICYETISNQWSESSSARSTEDRSVRHPHIGGDRIASSRGGGGPAGGGGILSEQQRRGAGRPDRGDALQRDRWNRHQSGGLHAHQCGRPRCAGSGEASGDRSSYKQYSHAGRVPEPFHHGSGLRGTSRGAGCGRIRMGVPRTGPPYRMQQRESALSAAGREYVRAIGWIRKREAEKR